MSKSKSELLVIALQKTRKKLLGALIKCENTTPSISKLLKINSKTAAHHLKILEDNQLISGKLIVMNRTVTKLYSITEKGRDIYRQLD